MMLRNWERCGVVAGAMWLGSAGLAAGQGTAPLPPEPRQQYNDALANLALAVMNPDMPEAEAIAAARKFLAEVKTLPGGVASLKDVQKTIVAIERAVENKDREVGEADLAMQGPGSVGGYVGAAEGNLLRFKSEAGQGLPELVFARVNLPGAQGGEGGGFVYISTTEVSVGQFSAIVERKAGAGEMGRLGFPGFDAAGDPRVGVRSWEWGVIAGGAGKRGVVPARSWMSRMGVVGVKEFPEGREPALPSAEMPMQYVSPGAAVMVSRLVGCRLPTSGEWAAARAQYGAADLKACNLRDEAWKREYEHVKGLIAAGKRAQYPDAGVFVVGRPDAARRGAANGWDDGAMFFRAVGDGGGEVVHHLVGNVAEYVVDGPVGGDLPAAGWAVKKFLENGAVKLGVVGGSALGDPAMEVEKVQGVTVADAGDGYSDVGFRFALAVGPSASGTPRPLAVRLNLILDPLPVLPGK